MVSTKLLPVVSPYTIKPKLRRSIPFGMPYAHVCDNGYGYEKLTNESQSLLCAITLYDSFRGDSDDDAGVPAAKDSISVAGSISSVLFSVDKDSISSGECSYSYSLCSTAIRAKAMYSPTSTEQCRKVNHGTLDLSGYSDLSSDITFMSRHAGLDYNGRTRPQDSNSTGASNGVHKMCAQIITTTMDGCATNVATKLSNEQLEATFSSDDSESFTSDLMAEPLSSEEISSTNERKAPKLGRKWLMKFNRRFSAPARSMNSPAA
jgi:hypothetical protein